MVWAGVYSSIRDAEKDSLLRFMQNLRWVSDEEVMKSKMDLQASIVYVKGRL